MFKTFMLLAGLTALFMAAGLMIGGEQGMLVALAFALASNAFAYWFSDSAVLRMYRARPLEAGEYPWIVQSVERLAARANIPVPKLYLLDNPQPNAFATGRNPAHGALAVTTGLLRLLTREEVEAVLAHEIGHIRNYDTLTMTLTATLAGAISALANFAFFFGGRHRDGRAGNPLAMIAVSLLAPIAAMLVQFAISRTREYRADAAGAELSGAPRALASALAKISNTAQRVPNEDAEAHPASAHLFIINPLGARRMDGLFSTHPHPQNRIEALERMAQQMQTNEQVEEFVATSPTLRHGSFRFRNKKS